MTQVQASAVKADAEMDVSPETLKALSPFQDTSQAFITVLDNDSLTGVQVNLDLTLIGGGVTAYVEGAAWNAGTTAALSATALAAAMNADMVAQGGTAVAVDETVVLTTNNGTDFAIFPTVGSDDPTVLLINDAWGSGLEPFHSFWDSEFNGGDNIAMNANDYLHLYLVFAIVAGSTVTQVQLRLRYGMGEASRGHGKMYDEVGLDLGLAAAGVLPIDTPITEYQFTVAAPAAGVQWYYKRLTIPVNDPMVKVLVTTDNQPDADDGLEILYMRTMRDSVTGQ